MSETLYYDLHIHSCLSPCGDNDMTPADIVGMARLKELDVIALTDHNACGNCASVVCAAEGTGLVVLAGMELCTSEEIHIVCLFDTPEKAMAFDAYVTAHTPYIENRTDIYGNQYYRDSADAVVGEETRLLVVASDISVMEVPSLMQEYGGVCFPAHIDRASYSVLSSLGDIPHECGFTTVEVANPAKIDALRAQYPSLADLRFVTNSDAHYLWDISERYYSLHCERTPQAVLAALSSKETGD